MCSTLLDFICFMKYFYSILKQYQHPGKYGISTSKILKFAVTYWDFLVAQWQNLPASARDVSSIPGSGRSLGEGNGTPVFLPGKPHGQKSLVDYSPWGHKKIMIFYDMIQQLKNNNIYIAHMCMCIHHIHFIPLGCFYVLAMSMGFRYLANFYLGSNV